VPPPLLCAQASALEAAGNLRQAERLYVVVGAIDLAIAMYRRAKQHDALIRLVTAQRPSSLREAHLHVARAILADGGSIKVAEHHFMEAGDWEGASTMYREKGAWDDAMRVARAGGGAAAAGKVAYAQVRLLMGRRRRTVCAMSVSLREVR
jgi:intraflagellar transport protein 172